MYDVHDDGTISGRKGVMGALRLYLDVINLFLMLLRIFVMAAKRTVEGIVSFAALIFAEQKKAGHG